MLLNEDPDAGIEAFKKELDVSPGSVHAMLQNGVRVHQALGLGEREDVGIAGRADRARQLRGTSGLWAGAPRAERDRRSHQAARGRRGAGGRQPDAAFHAGPRLSEGRPADAQKERDTFARLDTQARAKNQGAQSVGGVGAPAPTPAPPQR
jgi:hypothetical protein